MRGVYVDLETGGLHPERDAVTQIGAVAFEICGDGIFTLLDTLEVDVIPDPRTSLCMKALSVQGVCSWRQFAEKQDDAVSEKDAFDSLTTFLTDNLGSGVDDGWHPRIWAHNADFDYAFMRQFASRVPGTAGMFPIRPEWNCTKMLYRACVGMGLLPDKGSTSLDTLCLQFDVERPKEHNAMRDAMAGARCLAGLLKAMRSR